MTMTLRQTLRASACGMAALVLTGCAGMSNDSLFAFLRTDQEIATAVPMERGKTHFATHQYGLALQAFRDALAEDPGSTRALNAVAATFDQIGRFDLAEKYYKRALEIDPQSVETLNNLGYSHYLRGEPDEARKYLALAVLLDGEASTARANLALAERMAEAAPSEASLGSAVAAAPVVAVASATPQARLLNVSLTTQDGSALGFGRAAPALVSTPGVRLVRVSRGVQDLITLGVAPEAVSVATATTGAVMPMPAALEMAPPPPAVPLIPVSLAAEQPVYLEVANGTGRDGTAAHLRDYLTDKGVTVASLADVTEGHADSRLSYRAGMAKRAAELARLLPVAVQMEPAPADQEADIRLLLGADMLPFVDEMMTEAAR